MAWCCWSLKRDSVKEDRENLDNAPVEIEERRQSIQQTLDIQSISDDISTRIDSIKKSPDIHSELDQLKVDILRTINDMAKKLSVEISNMNGQFMELISHSNEDTEKEKELTMLRDVNDRLKYDYAMLLTGNSSATSR
jgi:hypothetical protein